MSNETVKILIFDADDLTRTLIENYLKEVDFSFEVEKYNEFSREAVKNDNIIKFIFIDINRRNYEILKDIKVLSSNSKNIFIMMSGELNTDMYVKSLRAGAKDFLKKPIAKNDFINAVKNHYKKEIAQEKKTDEPKVILVTSYEKGCGKTFFSINIAREIAGLTREKVLLIDFNDNLNNVTFSLDIDPVLDTNYFIQNINEENAKILFSKVYNYKKSSMYIISNGLYKSSEAKLKEENIVKFFSLAKKYFKYIIVDGNVHMNDENPVIYNNTDMFFYIISSSLTANEKSKNYINFNIAEKKLKIILNKYRTKDESKLNDIESTLEREIFYKIPMNLMVTSGSSNRGKTIREINPDLDIVRSYNKIARYIINRV